MIFHYFLCFMAERGIIYDKAQNRFLKISEEGDRIMESQEIGSKTISPRQSENELVINLIHVNRFDLVFFQLLFGFQPQYFYLTSSNQVETTIPNITMLTYLALCSAPNKRVTLL